MKKTIFYSIKKSGQNKNASHLCLLPYISLVSWLKISPQIILALPYELIIKYNNELQFDMIYYILCHLSLYKLRSSQSNTDILFTILPHIYIFVIKLKPVFDKMIQTKQLWLTLSQQDIRHTYNNKMEKLLPTVKL